MFDKRRVKKFDKRLADIATWRLMQELSNRGTLKASPINDKYGCPLLQQFGDDGLPLFAPRD